MGQPAFLLFTGTNDRAVVALVRCFEACGAAYSLIARSDRDRILSSRYRAHVHVVREGEEMSLDIFERLLAEARRRASADTFVVVPNSEFLNCCFLELDRDVLRERLGCELPLVDRDLYHRLSDKLAAAETFAAAGIRVPKRFPSAAPRLLPLVAKPARNVDDRGIVRYPLLLRCAEELESFLAREDRGEFFVQEYIKGTSQYLLAYFAGNGEVFVSSQTNIAQQPSGKSIVLAVTASFHTDPVAAESLGLLRALGFRGFAMLEFIVDDAGPCFIELNPRPWGPLQLCRDHRCGIVEAFVGDLLSGDPRRHEALWRERPLEAAYCWLGGMLETRRTGGALQWSPAAGSHAVRLARGVLSDVYLRPDTWRIFVRELCGR